MKSVLEIKDHGDIPPNLDDLVDHLGGIPANRISLTPPIGTAHDKDVLRWKLSELIDGVLVVKPGNMFKSLLNTALLVRLGNYEKEQGTGFVLGANAPYRLAPGIVRRPDLSFVSFERLGSQSIRNVEIADFAPDFAVDFITQDNTQREMQRKRDEYFDAGTKLVWTVDIAERGVWVTHLANGERHSNWHSDNDEISGGDVLPGFVISINQWFKEAEKF